TKKQTDSHALKNISQRTDHARVCCVHGMEIYHLSHYLCPCLHWPFQNLEDVLFSFGKNKNEMEIMTVPGFEMMRMLDR
ncbi:hypothetical protein, partial [Saccharospirillum mangrovi]|uniref:hypothetical protein n=1 Tax=Saccharospirillum mangrovi TaxID=2161747 RepID=UPI001E4163B4